MRKRIIESEPPRTADTDWSWLAIDQLAQVEISSEDAGHAIESALVADQADGWRASAPGEQVIRLMFDQPQTLSRIQLLFVEEARARTQEFVLKWSADGGSSWRDIARQQYNFSPPDTVRELEDYRVELIGINALELRIIPEISGGDAIASLRQMRIAG